MKSSTKQSTLAAVLGFILTGLSGISLAQDKETVLKDREAFMKGQGKDIGSVKSYIDGKGDLARSEAGAPKLTESTKKIPDMFPPGTDGTDTEGKYATKPAIWSDWNKFL